MCLEKTTRQTFHVIMLLLLCVCSRNLTLVALFLLLSRANDLMCSLCIQFSLLLLLSIGLLFSESCACAVSVTCKIQRFLLWICVSIVWLECLCLCNSSLCLSMVCTRCTPTDVHVQWAFFSLSYIVRRRTRTVNITSQRFITLILSVVICSNQIRKKQPPMKFDGDEIENGPDERGKTQEIGKQVENGFVCGHTTLWQSNHCCMNAILSFCVWVFELYGLCGRWKKREMIY